MSLNVHKNLYCDFLSHSLYEGYLESSLHDIITPQCVDKMLSNNIFMETKFNGYLMVYFLSKKDSACMCSACSK